MWRRWSTRKITRLSELKAMLRNLPQLLCICHIIKSFEKYVVWECPVKCSEWTGWIWWLLSQREVHQQCTKPIEMCWGLKVKVSFISGENKTLWLVVWQLILGSHSIYAIKMTNKSFNILQQQNLQIFQQLLDLHYLSYLHFVAHIRLSHHRVL